MATTLTATYAAEVRVCNKIGAQLNNVYVNNWNYKTLNIAECTDYVKNPMAQEYVAVGVRLDGKSFTYRPTKTSQLLEESKYSYEISIADEKLHLNTVKD
jgi:hypothetical protein